MDYVVACPAPPTLPVCGTEARFPVRRIYLVGRNFAAHAREMGGDPEREPPFFFMKPADAVVADAAPVPYPPGTADLQHEIELVVAIGRAAGPGLTPAAALDCIYGYAAGIDLTRRDRQARAKRDGRPWEAGKAFDHSAPVGPIAPAAHTGHPPAGRIWLRVNGALRQDGDLAQMIWSVPETLAQVAGLFTLAPGDLVFTGTPAGVAPVSRGDHLTGGIEGIGEVSAHIL